MYMRPLLPNLFAYQWNSSVLEHIAESWVLDFKICLYLSWHCVWQWCSIEALNGIKCNKKTARRAENPARPQILLGAYSPTRHTVHVYDISVSFKAIADSGVESPYIISNHKKSLCYHWGKISDHTPTIAQGIFFQNVIISSLGQKEGSCEKNLKINNRHLYNLDMLLQFI